MRARSRRLAVVASCAAVTTLCVGRATRADDPLDLGGVELHLTFFDPCHTVTDLGPGTLREIQRLLGPAGVAVTGRSATAGRATAGGGVHVVLLPFDPSRPRTQVVGGVARPAYDRQLTVWAFPPRVAGGLGLDLGWMARWSDRDHQEFEKALAVVVVHELGHALAGAGHRRRGVMSTRLRREQLLDSKLAIDEDLLPAFRAGAAALDETRSRPNGSFAVASVR
jgi:hypothetical protein